MWCSRRLKRCISCPSTTPKEFTAPAEACSTCQSKRSFGTLPGTCGPHVVAYILSKQDSQLKQGILLGQYKPVERGANGSLAMLASSLDRGLGKPVKMSRAILATRSSLEMLPAVGPVRGCMASTVLSNRSLSCQEMHTSSGLSYSSMQCNSFTASFPHAPPEDRR